MYFEFLRHVEKTLSSLPAGRPKVVEPCSCRTRVNLSIKILLFFNLGPKPYWLARCGFICEGGSLYVWYNDNKGMYIWFG